MSNRVLFWKSAALGAVLVPFAAAWAQEGSGLAPDRLGLGGEAAAPAVDGVSLTTKGEVIPGDPGTTRLPDLGLPDDGAGSEGQQLPAIKSLPDAVAKLGPAKRAEIETLITEAATFIQGIRLQEGLERLIRIEELTKEFYATYNLRGAIYTKLRDFTKARAAFEKALELEPGLLEAMFNLAEIDFVEGKFAAAEQGFGTLKDEHGSQLQRYTDTAMLVEYKLFLSKLMQSKAPGDTKEQEALAMLEPDPRKPENEKHPFSYLSDYPLFYYSQAALAFRAGRKEEAEDWMASASRIYSKPMQTIYIDALIELGWVQAL